MNMEYRYVLDIGNSEQQTNKITDILGVIPNNKHHIWGYELIEKCEDDYIDFINIFLDILQNKYQYLKELGIERGNIIIWMTYAYEHQCNLQFKPKDLKRLGDNGIKLCISCYDVGTYEEETEQ